MDNLTIVLPVYNERESILHVLSEWDQVLKTLKINYLFMICEDGSTDGTVDILRRLSRRFPILLNTKVTRRGYGKAVVDGIISSHSKFILCLDSDGQYDPKDFVRFWKNRNRFPVITGWRISRNDPTQRKLFSKSFGIVHSLLFPNRVHDPSCPFVLFKRTSVLPILPWLGFLKEGFWWGFVASCVKGKLLIKELPVNHRERIGGKTRVYLPKKMPGIVFRNLTGLLLLKLAK